MSPLIQITENKQAYNGACAASPYPCERCRNEESFGIHLLGSYPVTLCNECRRKFEAYIREFSDYQVWVISHWQLQRCPTHEEKEYFLLYTESQKNLYSAIKDFFKKKKGERGDENN